MKWVVIMDFIKNHTEQFSNIDLTVPMRKKTPEERKEIREKIFRERKAAFDMLAKY